MAKGKRAEDSADRRAAADDSAAVRLSAHPRALASIRRTRGWSGLIGFAAVTLLSLRAGVPAPDALLRGLAGGAAAHLVGWFLALKLWKYVVLGELVVAQERHEQRVEARKRRATEQAAAILTAEAAARAPAAEYR